ncbi:hypothetical protein OG323_06065 [Streptomyces cyaneofuscatus]|uniref:hypothetical protein n=1 Tax=Streptomyces cyaneofuscatus TaxID=66883 RepID=UPI00386E7CE6|nr:hypothetical protein OG323_06065 [Streptomyces cyaneofuscatus]
MGRREYIGTGGLRLHLDDPPTGEMAKQVARGHLVPVSGSAPDVPDGDKSLVVVDGAEATTADRIGTKPPVGEKPGDDGTAKQWATYAVTLGLLADHAYSLTLTQLQEWVAAHEDALGEGTPAPVPNLDPESPATPATEVPDRPAASAKVADWREYAIALGMDPDQAKDATKQECQDYAQVVEDARETAVDPEGQE